VGGQLHNPARFIPGKETRYPLYWRLGGPEGLSGLVGKFAPTGIRSSDRPARSETLKRLSYPGSHRCKKYVRVFIYIYIIFFFFFFFFFFLLWRCDPGLLIVEVSRSHTTTHHSRYDSSGRVISSPQKTLPDNTKHSLQTNIHAPFGIRTHDFSRRAAADLRLRPPGHWDRQQY